MLEKALERPSEEDLERQLDIEWFTRSDARGVVAGPDSRADLPKAIRSRGVIAELRWSGIC